MTIQLTYGKNPNPLRFSSFSEFYEALGFLANQRRTSIHWEHNEDDGAWGSEGRIHCITDLDRFPHAFINKFTAGNPSCLHRINCNPYIICLIKDFDFIEQRRPNITTVDIIPPDIAHLQGLIPEENMDDFIRGYRR